MINLGDMSMRLLADTMSFQKMLGSANKTLKDTERRMGFVARANATLQKGFQKLGSFGNMLDGMERPMKKFGRDLTGLITLPVVGFATAGISAFLDFAKTNAVAARQAQELADEMAALKKDFFALALELGRALVPYLIIGIRLVRQVVLWFKSLSDETKKYTMIVVGVLAVLGPLLVLFGEIIGVIGTVISLVAFLGGAFLSWIVVIGLVVAALALVVDAIMQMTDTGNLGIIDMVNNFRIGGAKISTWLTTAWLHIFKGFENMKFGIMLGWETLKAKAVDAALAIRSKFLQSYKQVIEGLRALMDWATEGPGKQAMMTGFDMALANFDSMINQSLTDAQNRHQEYYDAVGRMSADHLKNQQAYSDTIQGLFADDAREAAKQAKAPSMWERFKSFFNLKLEDLPKARRTGGGTSMSSSLAQVHNLRQFNLEGQGGLSSGSAKKQDVKDEGVWGRLDKINSTLGRGFTATLG